MHVSIEHSKSGNTFGVAFRKSEKDDKPFSVIKCCKIAETKTGDRFISGPSSKLDNGEWLQYIYFDKGFSEYLLKLYDASAPKQTRSESKSDDEDLPF